MRSKVCSDWLPSYIKATWPVLELFKMAGYFPERPRIFFSEYYILYSFMCLVFLFLPFPSHSSRLSLYWNSPEVAKGENLRGIYLVHRPGFESGCFWIQVSSVTVCVGLIICVYYLNILKYHLFDCTEFITNRTFYSLIFLYTIVVHKHCVEIVYCLMKEIPKTIRITKHV
jgi:hypothetical protein